MPIKRQNRIALLLLLLLSHAALTLHVSTHIPVDQTNCDYCAGHADPGHAIAFTATDVQSLLAFDSAVPLVSVAVQSAPLVFYRQRAPPVLA